MLSDIEPSSTRGVTPVEIDTAEDFVSMKIDGLLVEVDVIRAHAEMAKIDTRFRDDEWTCWACSRPFHPADLTAVSCPECNSAERVERDPRWLDAVSAFVLTLGPARCGRRAAGAFYSAIVEHVTALKKTTEPEPG